MKLKKNRSTSEVLGLSIEEMEEKLFDILCSIDQEARGDTDLMES